jgi:hypothetical protein
MSAARFNRLTEIPTQAIGSRGRTLRWVTLAKGAGSIPLPEGASAFDERCENKRKRKRLRGSG